MCVICEVKTSSTLRSDKVIKFNIDKYCKTLLETMFSLPDRDGLRKFVADRLRQTAEEIELHISADEALGKILAESQGEIDKKSLRIEAAMLRAEGEFYTTYGVVMPESVRAEIKAREWDAMDQGHSVATMEAPQQETGDVGTESSAV